MTAKQGEALKALIDLAVKSNANTSIVIGRSDKGKIQRAAVICDGQEAKLLVKLMREAQMTEEK